MNIYLRKTNVLFFVSLLLLINSDLILRSPKDLQSQFISKKKIKNTK